MIIFDDFFDYWEDFFESVVCAYGLEDCFVCWWMVFHEFFCCEIVKSV